MKTKKIFNKGFLFIGLIVLIIFFLTPYFVMTVVSLKSNKEVLADSIAKNSLKQTILPDKFTLANFGVVLEYYPRFISSITNSIIISSGTTILTLFLSILAAYALSRYSFRFKSLYKIMLFFTQMVPGVIFLLPYFIIIVLIKKYLFINLKESYIGLIIAYTSFSLPFSTLMITKFINAVPKSYDEQAMIDGCSKISLLFKIIVPMIMPGILTIAIYCFIFSWNDIVFAFAMTSVNFRTVSIGLTEFHIVTYKMAACVIITVPAIILIFRLQKYFKNFLIISTLD